MSGRRDRPWTPENDAALRQMKAAGLTVEAIAGAIDRTPGAIMSRVYHLSVKDPLTPKVRGGTDRMGQRVEDYLARIARINGYSLPGLKRECYGWR